MPELPEVETIRRSLEKTIKNLTICQADIYLPQIVKIPSTERFLEQVANKKVTGIERKGKYLLIRLAQNMTLVVHFRMTGKFICCDPKDPVVKHTHLVFQLDNNSELRYNDVRQFGRFYLLESNDLNQIPGLKKMGIEPFDACFTRDYLKKHIKFRRTKIKPLLMDQCFIAGIGNIYADEILQAAKIHPERLACSLNAREIANLYLSIKKVLNKGIEYNGASIRDYVDSNGEKGRFQEQLAVYNREGEPCINCSTAIIRKRIGGRSSHFCPVCQKAADK